MARPLILYRLHPDESRASGSGAGSSGEMGRTQLAVITEEEVTLGREPPSGGITIPSNAVSRSHGVLRGISQHWFFQDLGSTNGSWLNGQKIQPSSWKLLKSGDYLQLGDVALEVVEERQDSDRAPLGIRSLLVFSRGNFEQEYPVPEFGRALVVGGTKADLKLDVDIHDLPSLVVERRGDAVAAFSISKEVPAYHNGEELGGTKVLKDRDELAVDHYRIIFSDFMAGKGARDSGQAASSPQGVSRSSAPRESGGGRPGQGPAPRYDGGEMLSGAALTRTRPPDGPSGDGWSSSQPFSAALQIPQGEQNPAPTPYNPDDHAVGGLEGSRRDVARSFPWADESQVEDDRPAVSAMPRAPERLPFGKVGGGVDETVSIDPALLKTKLGGFNAGRYGSTEVDDEVMTSLEDKIWLTIGLLMVLALIGMVVWWLLSR